MFYDLSVVGSFDPKNLPLVLLVPLMATNLRRDRKTECNKLVVTTFAERFSAGLGV